MIGYLVLLFIVLFFGYFFFAPFYFEINTTRELYRFRFHRVASIGLHIIDGSFMMEIWIVGWSKKIDLFEKKKALKIKPLTDNKERKKKKFAITWKKIRGIITSFKVNKCVVAIDTGDVQTNAVLFPFFYLARVYSKKNVQINFTGENKIILEIESSLARMSWAFIRS